MGGAGEGSSQYHTTADNLKAREKRNLTNLHSPVSHGALRFGKGGWAVVRVLIERGVAVNAHDEYGRAGQLSSFSQTILKGRFSKYGHRPKAEISSRYPNA